MTDKISIAVAGAAGRMGRELLAAALDRGLAIAGATERPDHPDAKTDLGSLAGRPALGQTPCTDPEVAAATAGAWLDFTTPSATLDALTALAPTSVRGVVIGTTGFDADGEAAIAAAAARFAIVKSGNFSRGVALLAALVRRAAQSLDPDWDIEILETHHRRKMDAPSGTALLLGEAAAAGRGADLKDLRAPPYEGVDAGRREGRIGFAVRRMGGVVGEHEAAFGTDREIVRLSHVALDRSVFAHGALDAALWAARQPPGLYSMQDLLGFDEKRGRPEDLQ